MGKNNLSIDYIHARCGLYRGADPQNEDAKRSKTNRVRSLRNGEIQVLLGTETIARGIDIRTVVLVINYS
jgi:superfamily II DNA/RNA helicase